MLNRYVDANDPFAGLDLAESTPSGASVRARVKGWMRRRIKDWRCARLRRETAIAIGKLDERTLSDIGWPARYEAQDPCAR